MIKKTFIKGVLTILPLYITIYVLVTLFTKLDSILQPIIFNWIGVEIIGLGFTIILVGIFVIGAIVSNALGKWFLRQSNKLINKVPLANKLYGGVSEVVGMIGDSENETFSKVVKIEFPMKGRYSLGFVTNEVDNVYTLMIPTTPNPTNGFLIFVDKSKCEEVSYTVEQALKIILSMGVL